MFRNLCEGISIMPTRQELEGKWTQLKGQIRERWGQITDDELQQAQGDTEQLIGFLQQKTGETRKSVEQFVNEAVQEGRSMFDQAAGVARNYVQGASQAAADQYQQIEHRVEAGVQEAQETVRARPLESVTAAFAAGLVAGVVMSLLMRSSRA